jgi:hypothetical protein
MSNLVEGNSDVERACFAYASSQQPKTLLAPSEPLERPIAIAPAAFVSPLEGLSDAACPQRAVPARAAIVPGSLRISPQPVA